MRRLRWAWNSTQHSLYRLGVIWTCMKIRLVSNNLKYVLIQFNVHRSRCWPCTNITIHVKPSAGLSLWDKTTQSFRNRARGRATGHVRVHVIGGWARRRATKRPTRQRGCDRRCPSPKSCREQSHSCYKYIIRSVQSIRARSRRSRLIVIRICPPAAQEVKY